MITLRRPPTTSPPTLPPPPTHPASPTAASPPRSPTTVRIPLDIHPRAVAYDRSNNAALVTVCGSYD